MVRCGAGRRARARPSGTRYFFRDGRAGGAEPPNNWISAFGGPAWTRVREPDGRPGQWYLHTFAPEQPDLDWERRRRSGTSSTTILRFWLDRGVDGFRVDAAPAMAKEPGLPDAGYEPGALFESRTWVDNPHWDVDGVHDILRRWRRIGDAYAGDRLFVAEAVVNGPERLSRYVRPGRDAHGLQLRLPHARRGSRARCARSSTTTLAALEPRRRARHLGAVQPRRDPARRPGSAAPHRGGHDGARRAGSPSDLALGLRRARAAALLTLALPGGAYLYQGEELGLPEVEDLPEEVLQDPTWERSGHTSRPRRVPGAAAVGRRPAAVRVHRRRRRRRGCRSRRTGRR